MNAVLYINYGKVGNACSKMSQVWQQLCPVEQKVTGSVMQGGVVHFLGTLKLRKYYVS